MLTARNMTRRDARELLGIGASYDWRQLHQAYARQALAWHPDLSWRHGWSEKVATYRMALINHAYEMLRSDCSCWGLSVA